jgi:hypothetical protein
LAKILPQLETEIVKRSDRTKGFVALPRRWVVESAIAAASASAYSRSRAVTLAMAASISPARLAWARNRGCPHGDLRDRAFDRAQLGRFGETIIWRGSIPAPFTGGATSAVVVVDIHRPNAAAIKAAEATKAIAHQSRDKFSKTCCR